MSESTTAHHHEQALQMRLQAKQLLEAASSLDGLRPYVLTHQHSDGSSSYIAWSAQTPNEHQAASVMEAAFEPDLGESIVIEDYVTFDELCGTSDESRVNRN